ncbi:MAG TPA: hypothetical protein VEZ47_04430, partial [Gemmatirosa sp.]|nr:hypothetical protein [Gemmatirosa sp.]
RPAIERTPVNTGAVVESAAGLAGRPGGPLGVVADAVLGELERVLHAYVARLRSDPATPSAHVATEAQVEDHLATFLGDLAGTLHQLDGVDAGGSTPGDEPVQVVRDATAIQRVVAERHGVQRARLGWSEQEVRREFTILREELAAAVRRRATAQGRGASGSPGAADLERALDVLGDFIAGAERMSLASFRASAQGSPTAGQDAAGEREERPT